ncbi:MAG: MAPEG family protein [Sphingomonadales bacterium]
MDGVNLSVFGTAVGLAFIMVGCGITYAYRRILPYVRDAEAQPHKPPPALIPIFGNFMKGAWVCFAVGISLVILSVGLGPGVPIGRDLAQVPVSLYYTAALGLLLVILTYNVLHHRVRAAVESAGNADPTADRIARVHANYTEYVPTGLALLIALEWSGAPALMVHFGGALFTVGRYLHAWGYTKHAMASFGRIAGIQGTLLALSYMVVASAYYILIS